MNASSEQSIIGGRLLSLKRVAEILNISSATAYRMKDHGQIRCYKIRGVFRVHESDLKRYLDSVQIEAFDDVYEYGKKNKRQMAR